MTLSPQKAIDQIRAVMARQKAGFATTGDVIPHVRAAIRAGHIALVARFVPADIIRQAMGEK